MRRLIIPALAALLAPAIFSACTESHAMDVSSPDGRLNFSLHLDDEGQLYYKVRKDGTAVVDSSALGISCKEFSLGRHSEIKRVERTSKDETWMPVWGEESEIRNHYNEMCVHLHDGDIDGKTGIDYMLRVRVFPDGIGFRYEIPGQEGMESMTIMDELTEFALHEDGVAWSIPWNHEYYEHLYEPSLISKLDTVCSPLTVKMTDSLYVSIHEAALEDYAAMNLSPVGNSTRLRTWLTPWSTGEKVFANAPMKSPWRTMTIVSTPGELMLSRVMLNLNEPCAIEDTSWIEPSRYIGIWWGMHRQAYTWGQGPTHGATTENTKRYMDFAADNGFGGVLVEGWNKGWDGDWSANGDQFSFTEAYPDFDIEEIARYGSSKGVRLIGHHETGGAALNYESQMDSAFAMYNRLGINSVKTGYVNPLMDGKEYHSSQYAVRHYRKVIETAAKHHIMIDNHEPVMPTGLQRTYPNLMTQEGVRGCEYDAWSPEANPPEHAVTIPFTRCLAGPVDYTPGIFNYDNPVAPHTRPQTTVAKQLAMSVVLYSPLQMASDMIENYEGKPEFEFLQRCPVDWNKTLVPEAKIGEYVTVARQDKENGDWWLGAMTNRNARRTKLPLDFLEPGKKYTAKIFADGEGADYRSNPGAVAISEIEVDSTSALNLNLASGGGAAVIISRKDAGQ